MKTKNLIKLLLEEDPTGEAHVCVDNVDIIEVSSIMPAYYDGQFVEIHRDEKTRTQFNCYGITKVIARCGGVSKIKLRTLDAEEAFLENPEAEFEQDTYNPDRHAHWTKKVEEWRAEGRKLKAELQKMDEEFRAKKEKTEKTQKD